MFVVPGIVVLARHKAHYSATAVILMLSLGALLAVAAGGYLLRPVSQDLRAGTMSRYTGGWHERLKVGGQRNTGSLQIQLPDGSRLRGGVPFYQEGKRAQVAVDWEGVHGYVEYATTGRQVIALERQPELPGRPT